MQWLRSWSFRQEKAAGKEKQLVRQWTLRNLLVQFGWDLCAYVVLFAVCPQYLCQLLSHISLSMSFSPTEGCTHKAYKDWVRVINDPGCGTH